MRGNSIVTQTSDDDISPRGSGAKKEKKENPSPCHNTMTTAVAEDTATSSQSTPASSEKDPLESSSSSEGQSQSTCSQEPTSTDDKGSQIPKTQQSDIIHVDEHKSETLENIGTHTKEEGESRNESNDQANAVDAMVDRIRKNNQLRQQQLNDVSIGDNTSLPLDHLNLYNHSSISEDDSSYEATPLTLKSQSFEEQTEQIILEAQRSVTRQLYGTENPQPEPYPQDYSSAMFDLAAASSADSDAIIQQALDRALARSKAAVEAVRNISTPAASKGTPDNRLRTTQEVLDLANGALALRTPGRKPPPEDYHSPMARARGEDSSPLSPTRNDDGDVSAQLSPRSRELTQAQDHLSPSGSFGSLEDYDTAVDRAIPSRWKDSSANDISRSKALEKMDGIPSPSKRSQHQQHLDHFESTPTLSSMSTSSSSNLQIPALRSISMVKEVKPTIVKSVVAKTPEEVEREARIANGELIEPPSTCGLDPSFGLFSYFWGNSEPTKDITSGKFDESSDSGFGPMSCGGSSSERWSREAAREMVRERRKTELPAVATSLVRVATDVPDQSYAEAVHEQQVIDPRMPDWVENQFQLANSPTATPSHNNAYQLGVSRTVIVHEIQRGNWTWATAWSPDGNSLAVATENHHFSVIDTSSSSVWRVRHDKRIQGPVKNHTTHSIRSIAWGQQFIAIGGTGNAVSILAPTEPYPILHTIKNTGFVGSLDWWQESNTLVIGSRVGKAMVVKISVRDREQDTAEGPTTFRDIHSTVLYTIDREKAWVNAVKFSPGGKALAVADSKGILGVYEYSEDPGGEPKGKLKYLANFQLDDSILDVEWSPDGQWLYAGGEDFAVTVINTTYWEAVHRIRRDRWVQFISASHGASHVAVGGVTSEVSILEVDNGWDTAINVSLKGLLPLSAKWHPQDQYLVLTGQNNSILAVETTSARHVSGHFLRSVSPILAMEFSPDGRMAAIGNEAGVVTIFKLSGTTFITCYELVLECDGHLSIKWSLNGSFLAIVSGNKLVIVAGSQSNLLPTTAPPNSSGFSVARVIRGLGKVQSVAIDPTSRYISVNGDATKIIDCKEDFKIAREIVHESGPSTITSWSPDSSWLAILGRDNSLTIYDTSSELVESWRAIFTLPTRKVGLAFAWGPVVVGGLQYCAYGGEGKELHIMEIRVKERTWETVLRVPREGSIHDIDWNMEGLVAAALSNGTVTVMDLSYLQSGWAVSEMDYIWQRQALTCFTEIRRNRDKNCMRALRWIPSAPGSDSLLAVGGSDGELEIVDLTERRRCSGFSKLTPAV